MTTHLRRTNDLRPTSAPPPPADVGLTTARMTSSHLLPPFHGEGVTPGGSRCGPQNPLKNTPTSAHTENPLTERLTNMPKNPYLPDKNPRSHNGAQALIDHLTTHDPIPRPEAQRIIEDTGLAPKTADNIIIRMNATHVIRITGRKPARSGLDNRATHTITRGPRWNQDHTS